MITKLYLKCFCEVTADWLRKYNAMLYARITFPIPRFVLFILFFAHSIALFLFIVAIVINNVFKVKMKIYTFCL